MMWFFAVLVVLLLGVVAVVASGRGQPLAPVYDDRPDALVPAEGDISAADLRRVRFSLAFRGYRMSEVDALLDRLAREKEAAAHGDAADGDGIDGDGVDRNGVDRDGADRNGATRTDAASGDADAP